VVRTPEWVLDARPEATSTPVRSRRDPLRATLDGNSRFRIRAPICGIGVRLCGTDPNGPLRALVVVVGTEFIDHPAFALAVAVLAARSQLRQTCPLVPDPSSFTLLAGVF
jgi:hypothetical protein